MRGRDMVVWTNSWPSCAGDCVAEAEERCYGCYQIVRSECFPKMFCQDPFCDISDPRRWLLQNNCRIYQLHPAARLLIIEWNWKGSASIDYRNVRGQSPVLGGVHVIVHWPPPSPHTSSPRTMDSWTEADLRQDSGLTKRWLRQSSAPGPESPNSSCNLCMIVSWPPIIYLAKICSTAESKFGPAVNWAPRTTLCFCINKQTVRNGFDIGR